MAVGLGCSFTTQRCTSTDVFPYLCEDNTDDTMCTYDHLSKVCVTIVCMDTSVQ